MRTSRRAVASFVLGLLSIGGLCLTAVPALCLGLWALRDMRQPRGAEVLLGRRLAITGVSLGAIFCVFMFALPLLALRDLQEELLVEKLARSAQTHAANQRWDEAAEAYGKIVQLRPDDELQWLRAAAVYAFADADRYYRLTDDMLVQFPEPAEPQLAGRLAKTCLLLPPPDQARLDLAFRLAEQAVTQEPNHINMLWFHVTFGIAQYRRGDFAEAIASCRMCQSGDPAGDNWRRTALAYFVESLAQLQLGEREAGLEAFQRGRSILNQHPELQANWHDQLIAQIFFDEAENLAASLGIATPGQ